MKVHPQKEHDWLKQLVGTWECDMPCPEGLQNSGAQPKWVETVRLVGGVWAIAEGTGEMPEVGPVTTMMTIGYNPAREAYVGSWCGSMMTHLWVYEGSLDETGKVLTLNAEGPDFHREGQMAKYQDIIEIVDQDNRILRSRTPGDDGEWNTFMTVHYRRRH